MKEELEQIINTKLNEIEPGLREIYNDNASLIDDLVKKQNNNISEKKKRNLYLSLLKKAKDQGNSINYDENMSTQELENIINNMEVK